MQFYKALFIVMWQKNHFGVAGKMPPISKTSLRANSSLRSHLSVKSFDFRCILQFTSAIPLKIGDIFQRSLQFSKSIWLVWDESKILHIWWETKIYFEHCASTEKVSRFCDDKILEYTIVHVYNGWVTSKIVHHIGCPCTNKEYK